MERLNPYALLGVKEGCTEKELRTRYKAACKMFHPDKHGQDPTSIFVFQLIQRSYENIETMMKMPMCPKAQVNKPVIRGEERGREQREQREEKREKREKGSSSKDLTREDILQILGMPLEDPYFAQPFSLSDMFGDVEIKKEEAKK